MNDSPPIDNDFKCPQCGSDCFVLFEGYCKPCRDERQQRLDDFNLSFSEWEKMNSDQKEQRIKNAI